MTTAAGMVGSTLVPKHLWSLGMDEASHRMGLLMSDEALMRQMAGWALEAAKNAGAKYADVRVSFSRGLVLYTDEGRNEVVSSSGPIMSSGASIGIRAVTDGVWGFAGESIITQDGIKALAELAVARARAARPLKAKEFEFVDAPVVADGKWESPFEVDPTTIPFREVEAYLLEAHEDVAKVKEVSTSGNLSYSKSESVFASSEGSMIFQRMFTGGIGGSASTKSKKDPERWVGAGTDCPSGQYGYEVISKSNLKAEWHKAIEEAFRLAQLPWKSVEVGRYDIVLGAPAMAGFVTSSIAGAVLLNRARGDLANSAGTSYAAPPMDILGNFKVASPVLTVKCDRSRPRALSTTGFDADGVKPDEWNIVDEGVIVDYITTRDTAGTIADWYKKKNLPLRSHGCSKGGGMGQPGLGYPNLTIQPGRTKTSTEDLYKGMKKGFYAPSGSAGGDQQLINHAGYFGNVYEIKDGKIIGFSADFAIQFNTAQFWKNLDAVGSSETAKLIQIPPLGMGVYSVPGRIKQVNVINTGKES